MWDYFKKKKLYAAFRKAGNHSWFQAVAPLLIVYGSVILFPKSLGMLVLIAILLLFTVYFITGESRLGLVV